MEDMQVVDAIFLFHFHDKNQSKPRFEILKIIGEILSIFLASTKANTILPSKFQMKNFHFFLGNIVDISIFIMAFYTIFGEFPDIFGNFFSHAIVNIVNLRVC